MAGSEDRLDLERPGGELLAVADLLLDLEVDLGRRLGVGHERRVAEPLARLGQSRDVVAVRVGDEDVGDLDLVGRRPLEQRLEHVVAVDQDPLAARRVGDEVGVGEPLVVLGALDDQAGSSVIGSGSRS
jgi:hypothetical protein